VNALTKTKEPCQGWRQGTCYADPLALYAQLGEPSHDWRGTVDTITDSLGHVHTDTPKVTLAWIFKTPRGNAEVRDYWWNATGEWSIAAQNTKAAMWLAKYLRTRGFVASTRKITRCPFCGSFAGDVPADDYPRCSNCGAA
jgi:hypothetical protein